MNINNFDQAVKTYLLSVPQVIREYLFSNQKELQRRLQSVRYGTPRWCENLLEVLMWKNLHAQWDYPRKGIFPHIDLEKMMQEKLMCYEGIETITECNFFLAHDSTDDAVSAQVRFMLEVVLPHVYERKGISVVVDEKLLIDSIKWRLIESCTWEPDIKSVSINLDRWHGNDGHTVTSVCDLVSDPIHVEALTHIAHIWRTAPESNGRLWHEYIVIPGIIVEIDGSPCTIRIGWDRVSHCVKITAQGVTEDCSKFIIPERIG